MSWMLYSFPAFVPVILLLALYILEGGTDLR
jgi:hypothetical protein